MGKSQNYLRISAKSAIFIPYFTLQMTYNTDQPKLIISEYGRNIQRMIDHCGTIEDRAERNRCARAIIQVMGQLNPHLRDVADFTHKLWDHLFIISDFSLDVDSPYPKPSPETFDTKPGRIAYPSRRIKYLHYGKTMEEMIEKATTYEEGPEKEELKRIIANHMKKSYITWNKDSVTDEIIVGHLLELSKGKLKIEDPSVLTAASDLVKRPVVLHQPNGNKAKHYSSSNPHKRHGGGGGMGNNRGFKRNKY